MVRTLYQATGRPTAGRPSHERQTDQPAFKEALYRSKLNTTVLTTEYNLRTPFPFYACKKVKILHGREPSLSKAALSINKELEKRIGNYGTNYQELSGIFGRCFREVMRKVTRQNKNDHKT